MKNKKKGSTKTYAIALDIGGTKIEGVLFDDKFNQLRKERVLFPKDDSDNSVTLPRKEVLAMLDELVAYLKKSVKIKGIGISITGVTDNEGKTVGRSTVEALGNFSLAKYFKNKLNCKIVVKNDADCFALGEQRFGAGKGYNYVVGIIHGTGIGAGIILGGKIYSGTTGSAGEIGHNPLNSDGPKCLCGLTDIQAYTAGPYIVKNYIDAGGKIKKPDPKKIFKSEDKIAKAITKKMIDVLAQGIAQAQNILNPEIIIMGGGLSNLNYYKKLNKLTKEYTKDGLRPNVKIVKNKLGDAAGVYGAATLIFEQ